MPLDTDLLLDAESVSHLVSPLALRKKVLDAQGKTFRSRPHQKVISDAVVDAVSGRGPRFVGVSIGQQYGKAIHVETPIPTPSGWTTMGELRVGDELFTADGSITHVIAATPIFEDRPCYSLTFDDGERIMADAEHLWRVALDRGERAHVTTLHTTRSLAKHRYSSPRINNTDPLRLPEISLPIDPYVLGVWLGDGSTGSANITKKNRKDADEIFGRFREAGYLVRELKTPGSWVTEGLFANLRAMGLIGHKHIPPMYLRASEDQRWALLQGLIDTDGYVEPKRGTIEFCTTKEDIAEGAEELMHSLGIKVMVKKGRATLYGRDISPKWRLFFYHPNAAFLTRKRERCREPERQKHRYVRHVVEIPSVPVRCIQVAHESGMYLCGRGMIPTHNSEITSIGSPEWYLELHSLGVVPGGGVGLMSYEDSLSMSWSTKIRREIEANPDLFYTQLRKDSRAAGFWETEQGAFVIAIGTAGSIQGRPISFLGIDDPTKNFDQAMSPTHQDKLWDLWTSVIYGRLQPWTVVLVTMARWAPDDFIGRLMSLDYEGDPEDWRFINIPCIATAEDDPLGREIGEPLIRPQADQTLEEAKAEMVQVQKSISTYAWSALWQQDPRDPEGTILPESKWRYWGGELTKEERFDLPSVFDQMLFDWDMAFKDLKTSDWVVGGLWGRVGMDFYLIERIRGRWSFTETCTRVNNFAVQYRARYPQATTIVVEDKANGPAVINELRSRVGGLVEFDPSDYGSKLARAWAVQPYLLGGNIYIPAESERPWVREYKKELADFRGMGNETDDQVDMTTMAILYMQKYTFAPSVMALPGDQLDDNIFNTRFSQHRRPGILDR